MSRVPAARPDTTSPGRSAVSPLAAPVRGECWCRCCRSKGPAGLRRWCRWPGRTTLPRPGAWQYPRRPRFAARGDLDEAVIVGVGDQQVAVRRVDHHVLRALELVAAIDGMHLDGSGRGGGAGNRVEGVVASLVSKWRSRRRRSLGAPPRWRSYLRLESGLGGWRSRRRRNRAAARSPVRSGPASAARRRRRRYGGGVAGVPVIEGDRPVS